MPRSEKSVRKADIRAGKLEAVNSADQPDWLSSYLASPKTYHILGPSVWIANDFEAYCTCGKRINAPKDSTINKLEAIDLEFEKHLAAELSQREK